MAPEDNMGAVGPRIVRGRVDSVSLFEITEHELQVLEEGLPGSTYLTLAVFFLSVASSFLIALLTAPPESTRTFIVFVAIVTVGCAVGGVLGVLWYKTRKRVRRVLEKIKDRCAPAPAGIAEAATTGEGETEASAS